MSSRLVIAGKYGCAAAASRGYRGFRSNALRAAWIFGLLLVGFPAQLQAQPSAAELGVARRLFNEATTLERSQMWAEAAAKLKEALTIKDTPGLRYHLAFCEEKQGLLIEAQADYERAEELIRKGAKAPDVASLLEPALNSLRTRLPTLMLDLPDGTTGITVDINGKPAAPALAERPTPINPGHYTVSVKAAGRKTFRTEFDIEESEHKTLVAFLPREAEAISGASVRSKPATNNAARATPAGAVQNSGVSSASASRTWLLIGESLVTTGALGAGIWFALQANSAADRVQSARAELDAMPGSSTSLCAISPELAACRALKSAQDDQHEYATYSLVGFAGAGLGAAATLATLLFLKTGESSAPRAALMPNPNGAWVGVTGNF